MNLRKKVFVRLALREVSGNLKAILTIRLDRQFDALINDFLRLLPYPQVRGNRGNPRT